MQIKGKKNSAKGETTFNLFLRMFYRAQFKTKK